MLIQALNWVQAQDEKKKADAGKKTVAAWPLSETPKLDGYLDDPAWKGVRPLRLGYADVRHPGAAKMATRVWLGYDKTHLHVVFRCREGARLTADAKTDAENFLKQPYVGLILKNASGRIMLLAVNPAGNAFHALHKDKTEWDRSWNPAGLKVAVRRAYGYWITELSVGVADLGLKEKANAGLSVNLICRRIKGQAPQKFPEAWTYSHHALVPGLEWTGKQFGVGAMAGLILAENRKKAAALLHQPEETLRQPLWKGCEFTAKELQETYPDGPVLFVPRMAKGPDVDGDPGDAVWQNVPGIKLEYLDRDIPGKPDRNATRVRILTDSNHIYALFDCEESNVKDLVTDSNSLWKDDCADLFLDVGRFQDIGERGYFIIETNPKGRHTASTFCREEWKPKSLKIGTKIYKDRWVAEMKVSFKDLGIQPGMFPKIWGANFFRVRAAERGPWKVNWFNPLRSNNEFAWRGNYIRNGHHPSQFGVLYLQAGNALPAELAQRLTQKGTRFADLNLRPYNPGMPKKKKEPELPAKDAEFVRKPLVSIGETDAVIRFEVSKPTDVTVAIRNKSGKTIRHLVSGMIGPRAPEPLRPDSLRQELRWDYTDDLGNPVAAGDYRAEVRLGLHARESEIFLGDPHKHYPVWGMFTDSSGKLHVLSHNHKPYAINTVKVFDRGGNFLRQVMPLPGHLPADKVSGAHVIQRKNSRWMPVIHEAMRRSFLPGFVDMAKQMPSITRDGRMILINSVFPIYQEVPQRLFFVGADGSVKDDFIGPVFDRLCAYGTFSTALSPNEKYIYITGACSRTRGILSHAPFNPARRPHHVVYRMALDGSDSSNGARPFIGEQGVEGRGKTHLSDPRALDVDPSGQIYVADNGNNRIAVFSADAKFIHSVPVKRPLCIRLAPKSDAFYVLCEENRNRYRLIKYQSLKKPTAVCALQVPRGKGRRDRNHPDLMALDISGDQPVLWVCAGRSTIHRILDKGRSLEDTGDVIKANLKKRGGDKIPQDFLSFEFGYEHDHLLCRGRAFEVESGNNVKNIPRDFYRGRDGMLYRLEPIKGNWRNLKVSRYKPDLTPAPFEKTQAIRVGRTLFLAVDKKGNVYCTRPGKGISRYLPDGTKTEGAFIDLPLPYSSGQGSLSSITTDWDGNIYIYTNIKEAGRMIPDFFSGRLPAHVSVKPALRFFYERFIGSVVKFSPEGGKMKHNFDGRYRVGIGYSGFRHVDVDGLIWSHPGVSYVLFRNYNYGRCNCERSEFDMDLFDRLFIPNAFRFCVEVVDKERNVLLRLGKYGTWRDAGKTAAKGFTEPELAWVTCVRSRDNVCFIGDNVNNRLWKVTLGYSSKAAVPIVVKKHQDPKPRSRRRK